MKALQVTFKNTDEVLEFVNKVERYPFPMDLSHGNSIVDAKSLLGIITIGFEKAMTLTVHADEHDNLCRDIEKFIVV